MKRIGIMGGTFNPVHKGHLALARVAKKEFALDKIIFIPSGTPPHKAAGAVIGKEDRYQMVKLAVSRIKAFQVSRLELDRPGYSYAVDTFRLLKKKFGPQTKLFYIMGLDSINEILEWKKPLELFKLCEFIVGTRPGTEIRKLPPLLRKEADKIHLIELQEDISASEIRQQLKAGKPVSALVPKAVNNYIKRHELYK